LDTFVQFIQICKAISDQDIFYLVESVNGMNRDIRKYNLENKTMMAVRTIGDPNQIQNYLNDLYRIKHGQKISNSDHRDITPDESKRIRNLQNDADFRATIFYKPEFPVFLFMEEKRLLILNHPEEKIEFYEAGKLVKEVAINYTSNKKWLKDVIYDAEQERIYILFKHKQGTIVKLLNTSDGTLETADLIPEAFYSLEKIRVHNGELFYLKSNLKDEKELIRVELFN